MNVIIHFDCRSTYNPTYYATLRTTLDGIPETDLALDGILSFTSCGLTISLLVRAPEVPARYCQNSQCVQLQSCRDPQAYHIARRVALPKHSGCDNTTNGTETNLQSRCRRAFTLHADVVCLVREDGGYVALTTHNTEEEPKVTHIIILDIGDKHETNEAYQGLGGDDGRADGVLVANVSEAESREHGNYSWWSGERIRNASSVACMKLAFVSIHGKGTSTHSDQDYGSEVGKRIDRHSRGHEERTEGPKLQITEMLEEFCPR